MKSGEKVGIGIIVGLLGFFLILTVIMEMQRKSPDEARGDAAGRTVPAGYFPQGFSAENLPDPESRGAKALGLYCAQCHELPIPSMHTAQEWEAILARMRGHMDARSGGMIARLLRPSDAEEGTLADYLAAHALRGIDVAHLPEAGSAVATTFETHCSSCHAVPDPRQHDATEWARVLLRMKNYIAASGRVVPADDELTQLREYLARSGAQG